MSSIRFSIRRYHGRLPLIKPSIAQVICGHKNIDTAIGYKNG